MISALPKAYSIRQELQTRLLKTMSHLPHEDQIGIILSWMPLDAIKEMVELQETHMYKGNENG